MGVGTDNGGVRDPDTGLRETSHGADQSDAVITVHHTRSPFCHTGEEFYRRSAAQHAQHLVVCLPSPSLPAPACLTRISKASQLSATLPEWQRCSRKLHYGQSISLLSALQRDAQLTNTPGRHTKFLCPTPPQTNFRMGVGTDNSGVQAPDRE